MRIKLYSQKASANVVMEVKVVEPYVQNENKLYVDGLIFDVGSKETVEEMLNHILELGFLNLTSYSYMILNGMTSSKIQL
mgnify:CR=1 FL=1